MRYLEPSGYSFWLDAAEGTNPLFESWLGRFQQACGSPVFRPHVTLLGQVSGKSPELLKEQAAYLCSGRSAFNLRFNKLAGQDDYFKSCYLEVCNPQPLIQLREHLCRFISVSPDQIYQPHLSLYYGAVKPDDELLKEGVCALSDDSFFVTQVSIVRTEGKAEDWRQVYSCSFL